MTPEDEMLKGQYQNLFLITELGAGVRASFSSRSVTKERLSEFLNVFDVPEKRFKLVSQVHGNAIHSVKDPQEITQSIEADGLITHLPGVALAIRTADCLPVFFASDDQKHVAVVHCGWKGLRQGILESALQIFWKGYGIPSHELRVFFGPCIRRCCYEVGSEFDQYFPRQFLIPQGTKYRFDLPGEALRRLWEYGVRAGRHSDCGYCTSCQNDQFFSARKEKTDERIYSLIQIPV